VGSLSKFLKKSRTGAVADFISGDVLEVGCGYSITYEQYGNQVDSYWGIEMTESRVDLLKEKFPKAHFFKRDLDNDKLALQKKFDTILSIAVIEHIFNQKFAFNEMVKHLKPGCRIVITTPTPFGNDIVHRFGSKLNLFCTTAHDDHIVIYNKRRFQILANEFDMKIVKYKRFQLGCNQLVVLEKR